MATQLTEQSNRFTSSSSHAPSTRLGEMGIFYDSPPPTSLVFCPADGQRLVAGDVLITGYAMTGIFSEIKSVEFSLDGGKTWALADLSINPQPGEWRLWRKRIALQPGAYKLTVRATDNTPRNAKFDSKLTWHEVSFEVIA